MTTTTDPKKPMTLTELTECYCMSLEPPTPTELERGLDRLLASVSSAPRRRQKLVGWSLAGTCLALSAIAVVLLSSRVHHPASTPELPALAYQLDGGSVVEGGYLRESGNAGMKVQFNEGSLFALNPGTRGRIRALDKDGARLAIERGTASLQVTHSAQRRWLVDVGPFLVTVKGTVFTVSWDPVAEQFELSLRRGRVVVSGPVSAGEIALRTGQRLVVSLPKAESVISEMPLESEEQTAGASTAPAPALEPPALKATGDSMVANPTPIPSSRMAADRRWSEELARGHWDSILADAKRMGTDAALNRSSSEDLFALADAARYRRQPDLARAALLAERRRFPNSPRALDAIFLLGRAEELRDHGTAQALSWYDEYLTRAPAGPFVGEALGRKMTLTDRLDGPDRARPVAEEYLRRFPKGHYAGAARTLLRAP